MKIDCLIVNVEKTLYISYGIFLRFGQIDFFQVKLLLYKYMRNSVGRNWITRYPRLFCFSFSTQKKLYATNNINKTINEKLPMPKQVKINNAITTENGKNFSSFKSFLYAKNNNGI